MIADIAATIAINMQVTRITVGLQSKAVAQEWDTAADWAKLPSGILNQTKVNSTVCACTTIRSGLCISRKDRGYACEHSYILHGIQVYLY
jgi:hypothetical protein